MDTSSSRAQSEIVILGGGLVGWSVAWALSKAGHPPLVIDPNLPGAASLAAAGMITPGTVDLPDASFLPLAIAAMTHYPDLIAELEEGGFGPTGYTRQGGLVVARSEADLPWLQQIEERLRGRQSAGLGMIGPIRRITGEAARRLVPPLSPSIPAAIHYEHAAQVNGRDLRLALRTAALAYGAKEIVDDAAINGHASYKTVAVAGEVDLAPGTIIIAAGAWSNSILAGTGHHIPITPQRGQLLHLAWPDRTPATWPIVETAGHYYLLGFGEGRVVIGATRENTSGFDPNPTARGLHEVLTSGLGLSPGLATSPITDIRVGLRPISPDGLPLIGRLGQSNLWVCSGHGPLGLTLGPSSGSFIAAQIVGHPLPIDPTPYEPGRFRSPARNG